ncbi:MAG: hypothetical protein ACK41P_05300 [Asticcacaulis sp.]
MISLIVFLMLFLSACSEEFTDFRGVYGGENYVNCNESGYCTVSGFVAYTEAFHVKTGMINTRDAGCYLISLPDNKLKMLNKNGSFMELKGELYVIAGPETQDSGTIYTKFEIKGRRVGWGMCENRVVYVE